MSNPEDLTVKHTSLSEIINQFPHEKIFDADRIEIIHCVKSKTRDFNTRVLFYKDGEVETITL